MPYLAISRLAAFSSASSGRHAAVGLARLYNEAIFCFMRQTLVFFTGFPALATTRDALLLCQLIFGRTKPFNPFVPNPILSRLFQILLTLVIISVFGLIQSPVLTATCPVSCGKFRLRLNLIR